MTTSGAAAGYFDPRQRAIVAAAMARMIPTDDLPGATEARTIDFLDRYLSGIDHIYAKPDGSGFERLEGKVADAWRQRIEALRATYRDGIEALEAHSLRRFGAGFAALEADQQDQALRELEAGADRDDADPAAGDHPDDQPALQQTSDELELEFVPLLAFHTRQGFYADPIYGGNHGGVGWQVIGFPGPGSLAEVHRGDYTTIDWFADPLGYPGTQEEPS